MEYIKVNDKVILTYLNDEKIICFSGKITKIKKKTFKIEKKFQLINIKKNFFIKNPNFISLKKII